MRVLIHLTLAVLLFVPSAFAASGHAASPRAYVTPGHGAALDGFGRWAEPSVPDPLASRGYVFAPDTSDAADRLKQLSPIAADEVLWLARCIYSESDRPHEQRLVAWVVRNRVETKYRGSTYRDVILEARQFSAFNEPTHRRTRILNLTPSSTYGPWQTALGIALDVYQAPASERPFARTVRHFYSPISMRGALRPGWADSGVELSSARLGVDPFRFRFFNLVDEGPAVASAEGSSSNRSIVEDDEDEGFLFPVRRRSGRVARPVRPSVRRTTSP